MSSFVTQKKAKADYKWFGSSKEEIKQKEEQGVLREELMNKIAESGKKKRRETQRDIVRDTERREQRTDRRRQRDKGTETHTQRER